jgi:hypothetical protein
MLFIIGKHYYLPLLFLLVFQQNDKSFTHNQNGTHPHKASLVHYSTKNSWHSLSYHSALFAHCVAHSALSLLPQVIDVAHANGWDRLTAELACARHKSVCAPPKALLQPCRRTIFTSKAISPCWGVTFTASCRALTLGGPQRWRQRRRPVHHG